MAQWAERRLGQGSLAHQAEVTILKGQEPGQRKAFRPLG